MNIKSRACFIVLLFLVPLGVGSKEDLATQIEGVLVDITDARIANATLTFGSGKHEYWTKTRQDGAYSIELKPGTYTMTVESHGFCTLRRSGFVLQKRTTVRFNLQMWVCPTDTEFVRYIEFAEVPHTHLKPLILYGERDLRGEQQQFRGPNAFNDGTGHPRQYPAIFTFNLLTVQAREIEYDPTKNSLSASGNVRWEEANVSGTGENVQIRLDGLKPSILHKADSQQSHN
jgi:hypothetical protein